MPRERTEGTEGTEGTETAVPSVPSVPSRSVDKIGVALGAVGAGASIGGAIVVAGMCVFRGWQATGRPLPEHFPLLSGPLLAGIVGGVALAWSLARPVQDRWYQAVAGGLALFGTAMLAAVAAPVDAFGGGIGLIVYALALVVSGWLAVRRVRRAAQVPA